MNRVNVGFSPCPNDTSIFHAMLYGDVDTMGLSFAAHLHDVEELNRKAFEEVFPVTKLSFFAWLVLEKNYELLDAGAALGRGCGPLLVTKGEKTLAKGARIAIPGQYTTAHLLLKLFDPSLDNVAVARFDTILAGVQDGLYDAGVIIHEGRFVYENYGLSKVVDLGEWWENESGAPIPLGCIAIRKDANSLALKPRIESILKASVLYSMNHKERSRTYVKQHAQELDDTVIDHHIDLYVNEFTLSLGEEGRRAIEQLREMAACKKIL